MVQQFIGQGSRNGNAILEYALIGAAICVACLFVLMQVGQNLESQMGGLKGDMQNSVRQSEMQAADQQKTLTLEKALGKSIHAVANDIALSGQSAVFTAGSNGNHDKSAQGNILQTYDPTAENLNESQQNALKDLANQAHKIAEMQAQIEAVSKASGDNTQKFHDARIQYNGDTYSVYYLASTMFSKELKSYDNLKLKLLQSGTLSINSLDYINGLTNNIQTRVSTVNNLTHTNSTAELTTMEASVETHNDGKKICKQGELDDNGKRCE